MILPGCLHIPRRVEDAEPQRLIGRIHFVRAHRHGDVAGPGSQVVIRHMQRRAGGRAGVLDIDDRDALESERQQRHLPANQMLALEVALRAIAVERGTNIGGTAGCVVERRRDGRLRQLLDRQVGMAREWRHSDANNVNFLHVVSPFARLGFSF